MAEDIKSIKKELVEEIEKSKKLEKDLRDSEKKFTAQYQRLLQIEQGIITGEEALRTIEREHIDSLTYHLRKEHKSRMEADERFRIETEKFEEELIKERETTRKSERRANELADELQLMRDKSKEKDKKIDDAETEAWNKLLTVSGLAYDIDMGITGVDDSWLVQIQDLLKLLVRIGKVRISDAARILEVDKKRIVKFAKILKKRGMLNVERTKHHDPLLSATRKLVTSVNEMKLKLRKKGRLVK